MSVAVAGQIDFKDGRRIWIPPGGGRPYWAHISGAPFLTDSELTAYGLPTDVSADNIGTHGEVFCPTCGAEVRE